MNRFSQLSVAVLLAASTGLVLATEGSISKKQAIDMALQAHPGEVIKAYQETKRGVETWEIEVKSKDGAEWEVFYAVADGKLIDEEKAD